MASTGLLAPAALGFRVGRRGQPSVKRKYLPSCRTRGFPTSAIFESKLSVRALMWSANSGTPRSSCICLILTYQGTPVARRRHLGCSNCSLRTWLRAADLHAGHAYSIMGLISCLYSNTPFLTERSLLLFRRGPSSDLLSEVSKFKHHSNVCFTCSILQVSFLNWSPVCWWKIFFLLIFFFCHGNPGFYLLVHLASFVIVPPK